MNRKDTASGKPMDISEFFAPESGRTREHSGSDLKTAPEIRELKSIVLGLEWEISDGPLQEFLAEVRRLEGFWKNDKIAMAFLRILGALGKYISGHKSGAHPAAIKLLHSCYNGLEEVVSSPQMSAARKTEIVSVEFKKYNALRSRLGEKPRTGVETPVHPGDDLEVGRQEITVAVEDGLQPALSHFGLLDDKDTLPGKGSFPEVETRLDQFFEGEAVSKEGSASLSGMVSADYVVPMPEGEDESETLDVGGLGPSGPSVDVATPPVALDGAIKIVVSERGVASSREVEARLDNFFADETAPMAKLAQAYAGGEADAVVPLADFSDREEPVALEEFLAEAHVEDTPSAKAEQTEVKAATPHVSFEPPPDRVTGADAEARTGIVAPKMIQAPKRDTEKKVAAVPVLPKLPEDSLATLRDLVAGANPMRTMGTTQSLEDALYTLRATFSKEPDFLMMLQLLGLVGMHLGRHSALLETGVREESVRVLQALYVAFQKMLGERTGKGARRLEILHEALAVFVDLEEQILATSSARLAAQEVASPYSVAATVSESQEAPEGVGAAAEKVAETSPQEEKGSSDLEPEIPTAPEPKQAVTLWQWVKKMFSKA